MSHNTTASTMARGIHPYYHTTEYHAPFNSLFPYYLLAFILSGVIIAMLVIIEWASARFDLLTLAFSAMLKINQRRLRCFSVVISLSPGYQVVRSACKWMLRVMAVTILCFLWQSTLVYQRTIVVSSHANLPILVKKVCASGLACMHYTNPYQPLLWWELFKESPNVCNANAETIPKSGYLTCVGMPRMSLAEFIVKLAVAFALWQLMASVYQFLSWIVFRSRSSFFPTLLLVIAIINFALNIVTVFAPQLIATDSWFSTAWYLTFSAMLLCARSAGMGVRSALKAQLKFDEISKLENLDIPDAEQDVIRRSLTVGQKTLRSATMLAKNRQLSSATGGGTTSNSNSYPLQLPGVVSRGGSRHEQQQQQYQQLLANHVNNCLRRQCGSCGGVPDQEGPAVPLEESVPNEEAPIMRLMTPRFEKQD